MEEAEELAALYVVDALETDEVQEFELHLAGCSECQREVADMRVVTAYLSRSVEAEPPASLRAGVLAQLDDLTQEPALTPAVSESASVVDLGERRDRGAVRSSHRSERSEGTRRTGRTGRGQKLPYLVAAAALAVAVGLGGWGLQNHTDAQQASDQNTQIISLLGSSDVQTVTSAVTGGGSGTVIVSNSSNRAVFVASGLPKLADSLVYELWTVTGSPVPAGTFTPSGGSTLLSLPSAAVSARRVAVTVEPKGGSQHPTTAPVMTVAVPHAT